MRALLAAALSLALAAAEREALVPWVWQRLPVGDMAAAEGGAVTARAAGPSAAFHNPAGLAELAQATVSASAQVVEYTRIATRAAGGLAQSEELDFRPNSLGFASGDDGGGAWAFLLAAPLAWDSGFELRSSSPQGARRDESRSSFACAVASLAWGGSPAAGWRLGAALEGWLASYRHDAGSTVQEGGTLLTASSSERGQSGQLRLAVGAQREAGAWRFGLLLRSPGLPLVGDGRIADTALEADGANATQTAVDAEVDFRLPLPAAAALGVAWEPDFLPGLEVEADLVAYAGSGRIEVLPAVEGRRRSVGAQPADSPFTLPARRVELRPVLTPRLGLRWRLPRAWWGRRWALHAGGWIEPSPVAASELFTRLHLLGGSLGGSSERGPLGVVVAASYLTSGSLQEAVGYLRAPQAGVSPTLADPEAQVAVRSFAITIASIYRF